MASLLGWLELGTGASVLRGWQLSSSVSILPHGQVLGSEPCALVEVSRAQSSPTAPSASSCTCTKQTTNRTPGNCHTSCSSLNM